MGDGDRPRANLQLGGIGLAREVQIVEVEVEALVEANLGIEQRSRARGQEPEIPASDVEMGECWFFIDASKAERVLGYQPTHTVQQGLSEALDWYRHNL